MRLTIAIALVCSFAGSAQAAPAPRAELPIRAVVLSDGARRYGVTLRIDGRQVEAGLDSGSTGLRVLPRVLTPAALSAKGGEVHYRYTSGTAFSGRAIAVPVGVGGGADLPVTIQRIDTVGCIPAKPDCPAARMSGDAFGIQGDGLPGEGFAAILGVGLKDDPVPNTFQALGATRWIIELPRPGEAAGRLVLNPGDDEVAAYKRFKMLSDDGNTIAGCLVVATRTAPICGPAVLDTGAPGLRVVGDQRQDPVPQGTPGRLEIGDHAGAIGFDIVTGRRELASRLTFEQGGSGGPPRLFFGLTPYFAWSVLYDPAARTIGFKPR